MHLPEEAELLRVFIGDGDRYHHKPLYEAIVEAARAQHLAGATVLRGYLGYGAHSRIHSAKILRLSEDLPVVVEIVDEPHKIEAFLPVLDEMMAEGLVTVERGARDHLPAPRGRRGRMPPMSEWTLTGKPALVVIHMQNAICKAPSPLEFLGHPRATEEDDVIAHIAGLLAAFRAKGLPVVFTAAVHPDEIEAPAYGMFWDAVKDLTVNTAGKPRRRDRRRARAAGR